MGDVVRALRDMRECLLDLDGVEGRVGRGNLVESCEGDNCFNCRFLYRGLLCGICFWLVINGDDLVLLLLVF